MPRSKFVQLGWPGDKLRTRPAGELSALCDLFVQFQAMKNFGATKRQWKALKLEFVRLRAFAHAGMCER